ncbi:hypothetical protein N7474_004131 [Penicillium riverlandense]|uniref:uncharacterized protein n=1 Tax=Penicillium riverlandense TaxID=1903569 RepID=UPI002547ED9E|nr:uncharacterized protein N7474_004131 [Penicillium riverlandense]KAJ5818540.1 hypothetical protein N7474_004131 [Penicillium riverlandense]
MFSRAFLVLCGATTIAAQQHIGDSPFLNQYIFDSGYLSISTAGSDATHTTYIAKCDNGIADVCTLPTAGATIVAGPSYVGCSYTDPSEPFFSSVGCKYIDSGSSAACTEYQSGQSGTHVATFSNTATLPAYAVALGFNTPAATGTAGGTQHTSEASAGNAATATTKSANATDSAASATKTGGAAEMAGLRSARFAAGAAVLGGLGLII